MLPTINMVSVSSLVDGGRHGRISCQIIVILIEAIHLLTLIESFINVAVVLLK